MDLRSLYKNDKGVMQLMTSFFLEVTTHQCEITFPHNIMTQMSIKAASYPRKTECSATPLQKPQNFRTVINHVYQHIHIADFNLLSISVMCICWYYTSNTWNE
jgi:hypothetical protein